jgi:hypothetical protein
MSSRRNWKAVTNAPEEILQPMDVPTTGAYIG